MGDQKDAATLAIAGAIATITLDRPERRNAFDMGLYVAVRDAFDRVEAAEEVRAAILTGSGRAFCARQDLAERAAAFASGGSPDLYRSLDVNFSPLARRIAALPFPASLP